MGKDYVEVEKAGSGPSLQFCFTYSTIESLKYKSKKTMSADLFECWFFWFLGIMEGGLGPWLRLHPKKSSS